MIVGSDGVFCRRLLNDVETLVTGWMAGVSGFDGLAGFGLICFNRAWVAGSGLIRLMPGTAFLSANHKPSCTSACRIAMYSVKVIMEVFRLDRLDKKEGGHVADGRRGGDFDL